MLLAPFEEKLWDQIPSKNSQKTMSDREIIAKYDKGEQRILTEINREKLPSFVESLKKPDYIDLRPFYQRRARWNPIQQSRLIESFLINIPVPPIILYEKAYNSYEVMDGQQRITALQAFYENKLVLQGLELWPELNGRKYEDLPLTIKAGINRRSLSSIVLIFESEPNPEKALFLKQRAFERLNTEGVDLSRQEIRNCLYLGKFNELLLTLARKPIFAEAWGIPIEDNDKKLSKNALYKKMEDAELVLRFFALRHAEELRGDLTEFLDLYMMKSMHCSDEDVKVLESIFIQTIDLAHKIYGQDLFKPFDRQSNPRQDRPYKAYYDAVMVGLSRHLSDANLLISRKEQVIARTRQLLNDDKARLFTGGGKTNADIQKRIQLFDDMLTQVIAE
ncbi:MAG: DUF262 domain-containing protein [Hormoscilla sp. GUM202]|nr:DUF262 domain-containing protein [Hormoscilla sp. GUM202]